MKRTADATTRNIPVCDTGETHQKSLLWKKYPVAKNKMLMRKQADAPIRQPRLIFLLRVKAPGFGFVIQTPKSRFCRKKYSFIKTVSIENRIIYMYDRSLKVVSINTILNYYGKKSLRLQ